jgi:hypothetical protein
MLKLKNLVISETAVSEALGFILTLGIVLIASGIVYLGGISILNESMDASHFQEMEESFMLLGQNINEVAYERAPIRTTELKLVKGSMSTQHDSYMQVVVNDTSYTYYMGSLEFYLDDQLIAYENGGIFTKYKNDNTIMKSKPNINHADITVIPVMELLGDYSKGGEGIVRIRASHIESSSIYFINSTGYDATIIITSNYYRGWESYLEDDVGANEIVVDDLNRTVTANLSASSIYIDANRLDMEIF